MHQHDKVTPYGQQQLSKTQQVAGMFDNISPRYDLLNRVLSAGLDVWWRKKAIAQLKKLKPGRVLDLATGTADLAIEAYRQLKPVKITGIDISAGMLSLGREKLQKMGLDAHIDLQQADASQLPFADASFDAATVAFGVRNFENLEAGLRSINRVIKPGGRLVVLEFSQPTVFPVKQFYWLYARQVLPLIGRMISKDPRAYTYLPESVAAFPAGKEFEGILKNCGFGHTETRSLTFGIVSVYIADK